MAYSTQNMYQMFDIIPNFVRKMFPLSLKTYPSCTNTTWDIRDEIRSAYILRMVHQRVRMLYLPSYLLYNAASLLIFFFCLLFLLLFDGLFVARNKTFSVTLLWDYFPFSIHRFYEDQICIVKMKNWGIMWRIHF